ncbi:MAG: LuxR C-terminal-related transcriptional regulator [Proteiniphilum sp.]
MPLLNLHSVMADVLARHNELIPVLNRFGIRIGVGERTVQEICLEHHLNPDLILTVLNVYLDDTYLPESSLTLFDAEPIADYFRHTVENYLHALVPNIEVHLNALIATADNENKELGMLRMLFLKFKERMTNYLQKNAEYSDDFPDDLLHDLKNILIKHLSVEHNQNLSYAVIYSLHAFEKDLSAHNRLRNKVLQPKLNELDSYGIRQLQDTISSEHDHQKEESDHQLTNRETEILRLIVKGYLNKEIADELNISHNTVLTHRKNIITKTGIKTVSGLTFYCIRKGLISM